MRRASNVRRAPATGREWCRRASAQTCTPPGSPVNRNSAAHWRIPRQTAPWRGRSPAARRYPHTRSRRNSACPDNPRHICWSTGCPAPPSPPGWCSFPRRSARCGLPGGGFRSGSRPTIPDRHWRWYFFWRTWRISPENWETGKARILPCCTGNTWHGIGRGPHRFGRALRRLCPAGRNDNAKPCTVPGIARRYVSIHIIFNDHFRHVETDAGAFFLGGKVGIENLGQDIGRYAACVVLHVHFGQGVPAGNSDVHVTVGDFPFLEGILGIDQDVDQYLRILIAVAVSHHIFVPLHENGDAAVPESRFQNTQHIRHHLVHAEAVFFLVWAEKVAKIVNGGGHPLDNHLAFLHHPVEGILVQLVEFVGVLDVGQQQCQRVDRLAPLMGDIAGHLDDRSKAGLLDQHVIFFAVLWRFIGHTVLQRFVEHEKVQLALFQHRHHAIERMSHVSDVLWPAQLGAHIELPRLGARHAGRQLIERPGHVVGQEAEKEQEQQRERKRRDQVGDKNVGRRLSQRRLAHYHRNMAEQLGGGGLHIEGRFGRRLRIYRRSKPPCIPAFRFENGCGLHPVGSLDGSGEFGGVSAAAGQQYALADIAYFHTDHARESHGGAHRLGGVVSRAVNQRQGALAGQILGDALTLLKKIKAYPLVAQPRSHQRGE